VRVCVCVCVSVRACVRACVYLFRQYQQIHYRKSSAAHQSLATQEK